MRIRDIDASNIDEVRKLGNSPPAEPPRPKPTIATATEEDLRGANLARHKWRTPRQKCQGCDKILTNPIAKKRKFCTNECHIQFLRKEIDKQDSYIKELEAEIKTLRNVTT